MPGIQWKAIFCLTGISIRKTALVTINQLAEVFSIVATKECYLFVVGSASFRARRGKQGWYSVLPVCDIACLSICRSWP